MTASMRSGQPHREERPIRFTIGALFVWIVLFALSLACARYAVHTGGVLSVIALQAAGAAIGAPVGYFFGKDRFAGAIIGALAGAAVGMLVALLVIAILVITIVR